MDSCMSFRATQELLPHSAGMHLSILSESGNTFMTKPNQVVPNDLERREFHLSLFACMAIVVLAGGLALLMYPAVFSSREYSPSRAPQIAFLGLCGLSCLLVAYIVDRQTTIR